MMCNRVDGVPLLVTPSAAPAEVSTLAIAVTLDPAPPVSPSDDALGDAHPRSPAAPRPSQES